MRRLSHIFSALISITLFGSSASAFAAQAVVHWDPPMNSSGVVQPVIGYSIHIGTESGNYTQVIPVGNVTSYTISGLLEGRTYFFAGKAQDLSGVDSDFTPEVSKTIPLTSINYTMTSSASAGGSILPSGTVSVLEGSGKTYIVTPNEGYLISDVIVDGASVGAVSTYAFSNITADHTITAKFAAVPIQSYLITSISGPNGSISPSGTITVASGASKTFTITPRRGYSISSLKIDGVSVGIQSSYTFSALTANHTIQATFVKNSRK